MAAAESAERAFEVLRPKCAPPPLPPPVPSPPPTLSHPPPPFLRLASSSSRRGAQHLTQADFKPLLHALLAAHPGLEFLRDAPEFQERRGTPPTPSRSRSRPALPLPLRLRLMPMRTAGGPRGAGVHRALPLLTPRLSLLTPPYRNTHRTHRRYVETVIYRIFYSVNRSSTGSISLRELKRSGLLEAMFAVDEEEDINKARGVQTLSLASSRLPSAFSRCAKLPYSSER